MSKESFPQISHLIQDDRLFLIAPRKKLTQEICDRLRKYEASSRENRGLYDEQIWTLLFTYGFVAGSGSLQSLSDLAKVLTEGEGAWAPDHEARLEMQASQFLDHLQSIRHCRQDRQDAKPI